MNSIKSLLLVAGMLLSHAVTSSSGLSTNRRQYLQWQTRGCITAIVATTSFKSQAADIKSRTDGYAVQHSEREWAVSATSVWYYAYISSN